MTAGKKGANIQMLRSEYSANIKLPDSPGPERIFIVAAADSDTVADVIGEKSSAIEICLFFNGFLVFPCVQVLLPFSVMIFNNYSDL